MQLFLMNIILSVLMLINVDPASLDRTRQSWCQKTGVWTFGISGVTQETAPSSIEVFWENESSEIVNLKNYTNGFAFYETKNNLNSLIIDATAEVPELQSNMKFNLLCKQPTSVEIVDFKVKESGNNWTFIFLVMLFIAILLSLFSRKK